MEDKYHELDKAVSKQIMKEFEGVEVDIVCNDCNGTGEGRKEKCANCNGEGHYVIEY